MHSLSAMTFLQLLLLLGSSHVVSSFTTFTSLPSLSPSTTRQSIHIISRLLATQDETTATTSSSSASTDDNLEDPLGFTLDPSKYTNLLTWIKAQPGAVLHPAIDIQPSHLGGGYGVFCTQDIPQDTVLMEIPRSACVTMENALDPNVNNGESAKALQALMEKAGSGAETVAMAGFLALQRIQSLEHAQNPDQVPPAPFGPYLDTLPWERGINNQEHVLFWSDDLVNALLPGTMCYEEVVSLRSEVALATNILNKIVGNTVRKWRNEYVPPRKNFLFPWEILQAPASYDPTQPVQGLPEAVQGAFVALLTRAFEDGDDDDTEKLVPVLDLLQHSEEPNIRHAQQTDTGAVRVTARMDLQMGQELFNQYRSELEESMPYHRFFSRFGFVPGIYKESMETLLKEESSIFFAQTAEV